MPKVNRKRINPQVFEKIKENFWKLLANFESPQETQAFFETFFTPGEVKIFTKRLAVALLLLQGSSYQKIEDSLSVSPPTISRIGIWLERDGKKFAPLLENLLPQKEIPPPNHDDLKYNPFKLPTLGRNIERAIIEGLKKK